MPGKLIGSRQFPGAHRFEVVVYDLLSEPTECIVNAANGGLSHGGGVAAAISTAAGPELDDEGRAWVAAHGRVPVGSAVATGPGRLPFRGVIHAVGPRLGDGSEGAKIIAALRAAFQVATENGWTSLSFPGISSGIFSVPHDVCARAYLRAVEGYFEAEPESPLKWIRLVLLAGPLLDAVRHELGADAV